MKGGNKMEIEMIKVVSSNIESIGYLESTKTLMVEFKGGSLYEYNDVEEEIFNQIINADSVGSTFNKLIKNGGYTYSKL